MKHLTLELNSVFALSPWKQKHGTKWTPTLRNVPLNLKVFENSLCLIKFFSTIQQKAEKGKIPQAVLMHLQVSTTAKTKHISNQNTQG